MVAFALVGGLWCRLAVVRNWVLGSFTSDSRLRATVKSNIQRWQDVRLLSMATGPRPGA